jgi:hypothetical protein
MNFIRALNEFCKYIHSKNIDYANNISGHYMGNYKTHHKTEYEILKTKSLIDPTQNITSFIFDLFSNPDIDVNDF